MIVNTSGWDTDCNSGNVGCLLGIKNGLTGIEAGPPWRGPIADRLYLPTADGGRAITDAVTETYHIVNIGRALANEPPLAPKDGARFHWELPGAVQGFHSATSTDAHGVVELENVRGHSQHGRHSLALRYRHVAPGCAARVATPTFIPPEAQAMTHYALLASPTLYAGQTVRAGIEADGNNATPVECGLFVRVYGTDDQLMSMYGPQTTLAPSARHEFVWQIDDTQGAPIAEIGVELTANQCANGSVYLDYLSWDGPPNVTLTRPPWSGTMWRRAWVDAVDQFDKHWPEPYRIVQNVGRGLLIHGTREWTDYQVTAALTPHMAQAVGIAARVQGLQRYYALLLCSDGTIKLIKAYEGDTVLANIDLAWQFGATYTLRLHVVESRLQGFVDERLVCDVNDDDQPLRGGGVALICEEGRVATDAVVVQPAR
jgi:hypothetical protein